MPRKKRDLPWLDTRNGVYYACWYEAPKGDDSKGRTRSLSLGTSDPVAARTAFAGFLQKGDSVYAENVATFGLTVSKCLDDYEREHVNVKVTDKVRQLNAMAHLRKHFGNTPLKDLDIPASRAYADARRAGCVGGGRRHSGDRAKGSDSTIRRELNVLVAAISHARRWKRLDGADPVVELPRGCDPEEALWLTKAELAALVSHADADTKDFIILAYWTAARRASIETLRVEQVNLLTGRLNLRKAGTKITGKRKPLQPIHPKCEAILRRRVENAVDGWLFGPTVDFYRPFRAAARAAGIDGARAHPHVLRHSRATHLLQAGKSIWDVAKLLGDTIATTERVYGHHCPEHMGATMGDE
jgi:integrase